MRASLFATAFYFTAMRAAPRMPIRFDNLV